MRRALPLPPRATHDTAKHLALSADFAPVEANSGQQIFKAVRTQHVQHQGPFTLNINTPGFNVPGATDHGYGPLALIVDSVLEPGTHIKLHPHSNDEIISWVPGGVMRHIDPTAGELIVDEQHLMVMNAGSEFWHEERVLPSDPPLRMLQIFVRPYQADLTPRIQFGTLKKPKPDAWRHLVAPEGGDAPFHVRNDVHLYDIRLHNGAGADLPPAPQGWDTYLFVFSGQGLLGDLPLGEAESALVLGPSMIRLTANKTVVAVCFHLNPAALVVRIGTVGH